MKHRYPLLLFFTALAPFASAHPPGEDDTLYHTDQHPPLIVQGMDGNAEDASAKIDAEDRPAAAMPFAAFADRVAVRWDVDFLYVDSQGLPAHPMMVGITAWQQQVPLPQNYTGDNAWRIPLQPVPADEPLSAKDNFFRGAIALAANGVPIFNPIKNDGITDTFLAGELDEFGGHAGRGDDYHYHTAPLHLQQILGPDQPVAYALDGYPVFGLLEDYCPLDQDAAAVPLDDLNGHAAPGQPDTYHYHASKTYPYLNGGTHGQVTVRGGQIDPQPRAESPRPFTRPLRGATITAFETLDAPAPHTQAWSLTYTVRDKTYHLHWSLDDAGTMTVATTDDQGQTTRETFSPRDQEQGRRNAPPADEPRREPPPNADDGPALGTPTGPARPPGPAADDGEPRRPWLSVHVPEMDLDGDGQLTAAELETEVKQTFAGYDVNQDHTVSPDEVERPFRSALGGFVQQHFDEIANGQAFDQAALQRLMRDMFDKGDQDGDGTLTAAELSATPSQPPPPQNKKPR